MLISELYSNNIEIDFILLCETFLSEYTSNHKSQAIICISK